MHGVMLGLIEVLAPGEEPDIDALRKEASHVQDPNLTDLVGLVSVKEPEYYKVEGDKTVVLNVVRVPYTFSAKEVLEYNPAGVVISNGPGDPKKCSETIACVRELVEAVPVMGICLGNQILALSLGGDTYKMKFGHRSQNQPAYDVNTGRCYITTQNHGYAIDSGSLSQTSLETWFINANDKTVEGVRHKVRPVFAVQWHPEASPGPYDTAFLFDEFVKLMETM
jgi:carbamoyl-phosphate synthase small subunit